MRQSKQSNFYSVDRFEWRFQDYLNPLETSGAAFAGCFRYRQTKPQIGNKPNHRCLKFLRAFEEN